MYSFHILSSVLFQLEPGQSKDIYMPIVSTLVKGTFDIRVSASCFMERDEVIKTVFLHVSYLLNIRIVGCGGLLCWCVSWCMCVGVCV